MIRSICTGLALLSASATAHAAAIVYEPFSYDVAAEQPAAGGDSAKFSLSGKSPDGGTHVWAATNTNSTKKHDGAIVAGSLSTQSPMPASAGNSLVFGGTGFGERINIGTFSSVGTVYYSMMVQVRSFGQLTSNSPTSDAESLLAGFNADAGTSTGSSNPNAAALFARRVGLTNTYRIGIGKNTAGSLVATAANHPLYGSDTFTLNADEVFVVVKYDYMTSASSGGTQDALASLWINPSPSSFGTDSEPAPTATSFRAGQAINDASEIESFQLYQTGGTAEGSAPGETRFDELRVGIAWADVTPVPEPASVVTLISLGAAALVPRGRRGAIT